MTTNEQNVSVHTDPAVLHELLDAYSALASVTRFTQHEISEVFTAEQAIAAAAMINQLQRATSEQQRIMLLTKHIEPWGGVILKLLRTVGGPAW